MYKLFSFMVIDSFGHGQFAQHALMDAENASNMKCSIDAFKEAHPGWKEGLKVLMV